MSLKVFLFLSVTNVAVICSKMLVENHNTCSTRHPVAYDLNFGFKTASPVTLIYLSEYYTGMETERLPQKKEAVFKLLDL